MQSFNEEDALGKRKKRSGMITVHFISSDTCSFSHYIVFYELLHLHLSVTLPYCFGKRTISSNDFCHCKSFFHIMTEISFNVYIILFDNGMFSKLENFNQ